MDPLMVEKTEEAAEVPSAARCLRSHGQEDGT